MGLFSKDKKKETVHKKTKTRFVLDDGMEWQYCYGCRQNVIVRVRYFRKNIRVRGGNDDAVVTYSYKKGKHRNIAGEICKESNKIKKITDYRDNNHP